MTTIRIILEVIAGLGLIWGILWMFQPRDRAHPFRW